MEVSTKIGMLIFPRLTQLDLTGPYEVLARMPKAEIFLVSKQMDPVQSEQGLAILPTVTLADCPQVDILFVPGGAGVMEVMEDEEYIGFLQRQSERASYITAVCTGALVLAAAGLLDGYQATTHWLSLDLLAMFNVEVKKERVVIDRNRITGGGVTAGIDFGLQLVARICGEKTAKVIQLLLEYHPVPPFNCGSPQTADKEIVERIFNKRKEIQASRAEKIKSILEKGQRA